MIDGVLEGSEGRAGDRAGRCQLEMAIGQSNCIAGNLVGGGGAVLFLVVTGAPLSTRQQGTLAFS